MRKHICPPRSPPLQSPPHKRPSGDTAISNPSAKRVKLPHLTTKMPEIDWDKNSIRCQIGTGILWEYIKTNIEAFHGYVDEKTEEAGWYWSQVEEHVYEITIEVFALMRDLKMAFEILDEGGDKALLPGFLEFLEEKRLTKEYNENRCVTSYSFM
jgi:hypothetical protein